MAQLLLACTKVAKHKGLAQSGYRIVTNTGPDAGQTVFHLHLHVLGGRHDLAARMIGVRHRLAFDRFPVSLLT